MRRGFNAQAELAGMDLKERCSGLGHSSIVNQVHYGGESQINKEVLAEKVNRVSEKIVSLEAFKKKKLG